MTALYQGDPNDSQTLQALGSDIMPSTAGDVLGAAASGALTSNPTPRLLRARAAYIDEGLPEVDDLGRPLPGAPPTPEPLLTEEANRRFGLPNGVLSFDKPTAESTASELHDAKRADLVRADTIARGPGGIVAGAVGRGVTSLAMGILDPINLAAGLVPGMGEARAAALVGEGVAARALSGVTAGAAGMAALEPLTYALDQREHNDWTMGSALINIAFGGALGGGLHVALGRSVDAVRPVTRDMAAVPEPRPDLANPITARMEAAGPEARDLALRGSVAQVIDGQPVRIAHAVDALDAETTEAELMRWVRQQHATEAEILQDAPAAPLLPDRTATLERGRARLQSLRDAADSYRADLADAEARLAPDRVTEDRLAQIDAELARPAVAATRRDALAAERRMLTEGFDPGATSLDRSRTEAEAMGLRRAASRADAAAQAEETRQQKAEALATAKQNAVAAARVPLDRAARLSDARLAGREAVTLRMASRSIARMSAQAGVRLAPEEADALARQVLHAPADQVRARIGDLVADITRRQEEIAPITPGRLAGETWPGVRDAAEMPDQAISRIRDIGSQAQTDMVQDLARIPEHPDDVTARTTNSDAMQRTPKVSGDTSTAMTEVQVAMDAAVDRVKVEIAAGRMPESSLASLDREVVAAEGEARAHEAAAACLMRMM